MPTSQEFLKLSAQRFVRKMVDTTDCSLWKASELASTHFELTRNLDLIANPIFTRANEMFRGVASDTRKKGLGCTKSYPVTEDEDLMKIGEFFSDVLTTANPKKLEQAAMFCIMFYLCRRGRENFTQMQKHIWKIHGCCRLAILQASHWWRRQEPQSRHNWSCKWGQNVPNER